MLFKSISQTSVMLHKFLNFSSYCFETICAHLSDLFSNKSKSLVNHSGSRTWYGGSDSSSATYQLQTLGQIVWPLCLGLPKMEVVIHHPHRVVMKMKIIFIVNSAGILWPIHKHWLVIRLLLLILSIPWNTMLPLIAEFLFKKVMLTIDLGCLKGCCHICYTK